MKPFALFLLAFLIFACEPAANTDSENTEENTEETTSEETTMEENDGASEMKDIVGTAMETPQLSTLVTALKAGDLVSTLQGEGPFTVFAPTNKAFEALPEGTLDDLLKPENKQQLVKVLTYHVVPGKVMSTDLSDGMNAATVAEEDLTVTIEGDKVMVNDAQVTNANVKTSNGVVHIVDKVILPPSE